MKLSTKRVIGFFILSTGILLKVFLDLSQEKNRRDDLMKMREKTNHDYQDFLAHQTMCHNIATMENQGFFIVFNPEKVMETLTSIVRTHRGHIQKIEIGAPLLDEGIAHWPIHLRVTSRHEGSLYAMAHDFSKNLPGLVMLEEIKIVQRKKYDFEMNIGFSVVRGGNN